MDDGRGSFPPDVMSYSTIIDDLFKEGKADKALIIFHEMQDRGLSPNVVTYSLIIAGLFKEGKAAKACSIFHEMQDRGLSPEVVTYNLIIDRLCKVQAMDKARKSNSRCLIKV